MATFKLALARGADSTQVVRTGGAAIAGSDAVEVNFDVTNMNKGEAIMLLEEIDRYIHEHGFPA